MRPLAYHITWGTYGNRLHGDPRGTVDRTHRKRGSPVLGLDRERLEKEKSLMKFPPVRFTRDQRLFIETNIPKICEHGLWTYHICAAAIDHIHMVVSSPSDPRDIRRLAKRWMGQELSLHYRLPEGATWWSEGGSVRTVKDDAYLQSALPYVARQRATSRDERSREHLTAFELLL
jgi:REP element-mobilizing transposase RayT